MANPIQNNIKLGIFVSVALVVLIFSLYMIGKNESLFGAKFELRARFTNASGLRKGNNVLYAGIQAGTVKDITLVNDTTIEVLLSIDDQLKNFMNKNATVSIGTDGLMGNKVVQIQPNGAAKRVAMGDLLQSRSTTSIEEMLQVLSHTNQNIASISEALKKTVLDIDQSAVLALLKDKHTVESLKASVAQLNQITANTEQLSQSLLFNATSTKGTVGMLLTDTLFANSIKQTIADVRSASYNAGQTVLHLQQLTKTIDSGMKNKNGMLYQVLNDTVLAKKLTMSMDHIEKGTAGFNQNMEALKNNFLFRGYFKKLEKEKHEPKKK